MSRHRKLTDADVTPESLFHQRRTVLKALGLTAATLSLPSGARATCSTGSRANRRLSPRPVSR